MADKRMFSQKIIDSDAFLDMPLSTQAVYFHLSMRADDEGFINNPKKILRMIGGSDDEIKLLIAKRYILDMGTGVVVVKHWFIHNYIRRDRVKETSHTKEKSLLTLQDNDTYTECQAVGGQLVDKCQPRREEKRREEISLDERSISKFEKFIILLNKLFEENKILTFSSKINKSKAKSKFLKDCNYELIAKNYTDYVKRNKELSARLDKYIVADAECNLNSIEYSQDKTQNKPHPTLDLGKKNYGEDGDF